MNLSKVGIHSIEPDDLRSMRDLTLWIGKPHHQIDNKTSNGVCSSYYFSYYHLRLKMIDEELYLINDSEKEPLALFGGERLAYQLEDKSKIEYLVLTRDILLKDKVKISLDKELKELIGERLLRTSALVPCFFDFENHKEIETLNLTGPALPNEKSQQLLFSEPYLYFEIREADLIEVPEYEYDLIKSNSVSYTDKENYEYKNNRITLENNNTNISTKGMLEIKKAHFKYQKDQVIGVEVQANISACYPYSKIKRKTKER